MIRFRALILILLVAACTSSAPMTQVQAVADLRNALVTIQTIEPTLATLVTPAQMIAIDTKVREGLTLIDGLPANLPAQATTLQTVESYLNGALTAIGSASLPPPYDLYVAAAAVIVPEIEAYITSLNPAVVPVGVSLAAHKRAGNMSLQQARTILQEGVAGEHKT